MMTFSRRARTKQLGALVSHMCIGWTARICTHYARGKDISSDDMTSAMHMVADRETPTRQWTKVAFPSTFPFPVVQISLLCRS